MDKITIGYCKDCGYKDIIAGKNTCTCKAIRENSDWSSRDEINMSDNLVYCYDEGGKFYVGDGFGCVHFREK